MTSDQHPPAGPPRERVDVAEYEAAGDMLRALTAPIRLAIVDALADGPLCVHELVDLLGTAQPLVSQHLKVLKSARLVATTRRSREIVYTLLDDHVATVVRDILAHSHERSP